MRCAICRTANADCRFLGDKLAMPVCKRCVRIGSTFIATGYIGFITTSPGELRGSDLIDSLLRHLRKKGLVDEEDVEEVSE